MEMLIKPRVLQSGFAECEFPMVTFTDILLRYEGGETTRAEALRELKEFGLLESDAMEALGIAEENVNGLCLVRSLIETVTPFEEIANS
jgi:hypothetical protein